MDSIHSHSSTPPAPDSAVHPLADACPTADSSQPPASNPHPLDPASTPPVTEAESCCDAPLPPSTPSKRDHLWFSVGTLVLWIAGFGFWLWDFIQACSLWADTDALGMYIFHVGMALLLLYAAVFLQLILHEAGHLAAGLAGHMEFLSFRIGPWMWIKQDGKLQTKRFQLKGTGGQCLMDLPDHASHPLPALLGYNWGGVIANALSSILFLWAGWMCPVGSLWRLFFLAAGMAGIVLALINGIPSPVSVISNDGRNGLEVQKDPDNVSALQIQLHAVACLSQGHRPKDLPAEWLCHHDLLHPRSCLQASLPLLQITRLMDAKEWESALSLIEILQNNPAVFSTAQLQALQLEQAFCFLMMGKEEAACRILDQPAIQKLLRVPSIDSARVRYAQALLLHHDETAARQARTLFEKKAAVYPYAGEVCGQREWLDQILERFNRWQQSPQSPDSPIVPAGEKPAN